MDDETRRAVDEVCCALLGRDPAAHSPSSDPCSVTPLAKALRAKGWHVALRSCWLSDQWAAQLLHGGREITEYADTIPLALALAAVQAAGEEKTNDKI